MLYGNDTDEVENAVERLNRLADHLLSGTDRRCNVKLWDDGTFNVIIEFSHLFHNGTMAEDDEGLLKERVRYKSETDQVEYIKEFREGETRDEWKTWTEKTVLGSIEDII